MWLDWPEVGDYRNDFLNILQYRARTQAIVTAFLETVRLRSAAQRSLGQITK